MADTKPKIKYADITREVVESDDIVTDVIDAKTQEAIIRQVQNEFNVANPYNMAKRKKNLARLKLYNNQMRDDKAVGDGLMFTTFNTVHASLYDDRLISNWEGRGGRGDEDVEDNLNAVTEFDYDVMQKAELDYYWNWDAEFFGRGLLLMMDFNRDEGKMCPSPENLDASTFIRDPRATSVNGTGLTGKGAMRFGGWEVGATYYELKDLPGYFNIGALKKGKESPEDLLDELRAAHQTASGTENFTSREESLGKYENYEFRLLNWFTTIKGQKYLVTLGNSRSVLVRLMKMDYNGKWPLLDRTLYPMAANWDGVSIPDLTEDKQRARATLLNIAMESAKSEVTPTYLFDQTKIKNKNDLNFRINKFVGVDGDINNALGPVQKSTAHAYASLIMDVLDVSAQRATAATEMRQGIQSQKQRTLGEQQLAAAGGDTRFSMSAKIYGWSEKAFWLLWYVLYKKHFKNDIDQKVVRIQGASAPIWRELTRENLISTVDPDVKIESKIITEGKRQQKLQGATTYATLAIQDPDINRRVLLKDLAKLSGKTKEEISLLFPPTVDELQAEDENILLNNKKTAKVSVTDDHLTHIDIHSKANQNAWSLAHILAHKRLMLVKRDNPALFPPKQPLQVKGAPVSGDTPTPQPEFANMTK
jgi:hypothetical protein